jgi:hypothetical protein
MKTLQKFFLFTAALCLLLSFSNCDKLKKAPKTTTEPFEANAVGNYTYAGPDTLPNPKCVAPFTAWRAIVDGNGTETHLGNFIMHFDFCGDTLSNYGNVYAYLVGADGDTLFISCTGRVIDGRLEDHPDYVTSYWRDPFEISGGTGKFKGATGGGKTDDYNSSKDPNSHHRWTGTITLVKEKK